MITLAIETSTAVCSAALLDGATVLAERLHEQGSNHAALLPVYVNELLDNLRSRQLRLDAVALSEGPGSYTGLRIGTSLAKGLCYGYDVPLIPISTTDILCAAALAALSPTDNAVLYPMIDARRMEVYTARYVLQNGQLQRTGDIFAQVVSDAVWMQPDGHPVYFFGDGAAKCREVINMDNALLIDAIVPQARFMGAAAVQSTRRLSGTDMAYYEPFYLKDFIAAPSHIKGLK